MAIETGAIFKRLYFDGQSSGTYGVYITGEAVFSAPQRDVEMIKIPGRNGEFALDNGRFENIEVTYPAGIFADNETDFAEAISDFRNFLASRTGYCRLEDDYNPTEYRMAVYKSGLDVDAKVLKAGEFDITFDCKPQRWLKDGETAVTIGDEWGETETASGDIVTVENPNGILAVKSLEVDLEPIQSGSGTPSPTNVRPISGHTSVDVIVSPTTSAEDGTTYTTALGQTVYGGTLDVVSGVLTVDRQTVVCNGTESWTKNSGNGLTCYNKLPLATRAYQGKCNILPILDNNRTEMGVCIGYDNRHIYANNILNVISGVTDAESWKAYLANNNLVITAPITPQTYQLTAQQISLLTGDNNIWSDGAVTLEYGQNPSVLFNPTLFESSPLLETAGSGTIQFNGYEIGFEGVPIGEVQIAEKTDWSMGSAVSLTATLDTTLLNTGDPIYPEAREFEIRTTLKAASGKFIDEGIISSTNVLDAYGRAINKTVKQFITHLIPDLGDGFVYGTAKTITCSAVFLYQYGIRQTSYWRETVEATIAYGGADSYTVTVQSSGNISANVTRGDTVGITTPTVHGDSSEPNNDPIFIDCDLGEAYTNEGGVYRSLNQYIDLGSELPTLGVGANEVTFDNTITELKITPRWWKV